MARKKADPIPEEVEQTLPELETPVEEQAQPPTEGEDSSAMETTPMEAPVAEDVAQEDKPPTSDMVDALSLSVAAWTVEGDSQPIPEYDEHDADDEDEFGPADKPTNTETSEDDLEALPNLPAPEDAPPISDRQAFYGIDFKKDRSLHPLEQAEWQSIYASYRSRSVMTGTIAGVDELAMAVRREDGSSYTETMYCASVFPYRVRIIIPASEMWHDPEERPGFVVRNMVGATIDFVIIKVDREGGFAIASRRMALRSRRYFFAHRDYLQEENRRTTCTVLATGNRRVLVTCFGHDVSLRADALRYRHTMDLKDEFYAGQTVDCIIKKYDAERDFLTISVKEANPNPFDGADLRHPVGCQRFATITGKYGGGVFCDLPDGTVCLCAYSFQYEDSEFRLGDKIGLIISAYDLEKKQIFGKIIRKL